ncbi:MAG TPA: DUF4804 domain-containing protein, partial [Patescibacteria group bacterium]|nr:DUF4804 domain-containing protein [Patescibacteria group bacterium]
MSLKINALFPLVFFTFLRIYSFSPANEISLSLHNPLLKTKNKLVMTSITVGCLLAFFICYKICKHQNNDTLKISEKPMQPELTLPTNVESKGSFAQLISPQMIGCFILYTLLLKQPLLFSKMTNTTLPFLYQKMQGLPETQLTKMYEQLCLNRQNFFGDQIGRFSLPNSIETIPSTNYFGKVDMVQKQIAQDALTTHAIVHQKIITLITDFIAYKSQYSEHKDFFRHYLNKEYEYVNRLLTKRPMFFYGSTDFHAFPFGSLAVTNDGIAGFIENKMSYDAIKNYISYDEMPISALVGLCSPTYCINNGNRYNNGVFAPQIPRALYCGLVGTRFERPGYMEWQHIIIDPEQNTEANGYGQKNTEKNNDKKKLLDVWAAFYGIDHFPTYDEVVTYTDKNEHQTSYIPLYNSSDLSRPIFFHATVYKQRMRFVIEPFLSNANEYGKLEKKEIYTHAVGLGSGAWGAIRKNGLLYHPKLYSNTTKDMLNSLQLECYA